MISTIISRLVILVFGTLYPAYASYKAVRTKNVKEYVKWMMYWIVFALFTCIETFTDVFLSWFPFYYEIKIILVIWLLSPATKGSSFLYRKFVHPLLSSREQEIDEYLSKAKEKSYQQVLDLGSKGMSVLMQSAIKGGGGIVNQLRKSYSLGDLSDPMLAEGQDEGDVVITDPRLRRRKMSPHRSSSTSSAALYFSDVDARSDRVGSIRSPDDISSGYSSGENLYASGHLKVQGREALSRTGSLTRSRTGRVTRSTVPKKTTSVASDDSDENEVFDTNVIFLNDKMKAINRLVDDEQESSSEGDFVDTLDSLHGNKDSSDNKTVLTACRDSFNDLSLEKDNPEDVAWFDTPSTDTIASVRGGRYNKKTAPSPPIKATLVLKPGVVKNVASSESSKEVFVHSPKAKRRSLSSSSNNKPNPLSKLMRLPKKIGMWGKEGLTLIDTKIHSKSAHDLRATASCGSGSHTSLNSLAESPMAHRRLKIVRKLFEEDVD
ncbi:unnamed protein product [Brassicogethes aeneus]|uniref:Receptor expression-enhancing protein n=1 Tax=Brassicogethes aeneus TaxID=1431903 RepID=A0A9P0AZC9_BRAAE|nr:unnamed protein product [Brassicogethes aeneus]